VSGSLIAALLGIYEQSIYSINHFKEDFKGSISYLFPIGSGVLVAVGFLDATTMIIPGVSGTALFLMLGSYSFVLHLFSNPLEQIFFTFLFGMGVIFGIILVSRLVEFCFQKNKNRFLIFIYGLLWSSIVYLFLLVIFHVTMSIFFSVFLCFMIGFLLSVFFG